ncbi:hypothetical protein Acr_00g0079090 [Actinidia rufa]|uniref:PGG domain-containing protein n=1 Tax=Actinidia rufa TaxID=165716 RepID=A0A7J0DTP2_9ERIC|nr:hypothetical protein Acr_00g0079090 [Actinidia rufa]
MSIQTMEEAQTILRVAAETGDINGLYNSIKKVPNILDHIDETPFVDSPMHIAASAGHANFAIEIFSLKPSFGRKLNPDGLIRDETSLHIAVKNMKLSALEVLLGFLGRTKNKWLLKGKDEIGNTVLHTVVATSQPQMVKLLLKNDPANKNEKNWKGDTALDIAMGLQPGDAKITIENILRSAGASQSSSLAHDHDFSFADFLKSREKFPEIVFRLIFQMRRNLSMEMRNIVLVVAVLIATATFQAVLSPPGGVGGGSDNILPNGTLVNATMSKTNLIPFSNISRVNATVLLPSDNPFDRILIQKFHGKDITFSSATYLPIVSDVELRDLIYLHFTIVSFPASHLKSKRIWMLHWLLMNSSDYSTKVRP